MLFDYTASILYHDAAIDTNAEDTNLLLSAKKLASAIRAEDAGQMGVKS